jgi:hypothetical protein
VGDAARSAPRYLRVPDGVCSVRLLGAVNSPSPAVPAAGQVVHHALVPGAHGDPPPGRPADRRERVRRSGSEVAQREAVDPADHDVGGGVGGDQHPHVAGHRRPGRPRVVEVDDLPIAQSRLGRTLRAVLRHAVPVAEPVSMQDHRPVGGDPVGLVGRNRTGRRGRQPGQRDQARADDREQTCRHRGTPGSSGVNGAICHTSDSTLGRFRSPSGANERTTVL